jgi:hypothetical protein
MAVDLLLVRWTSRIDIATDTVAPDLNLPIGAVAGILFLTCLRLPTPPGTVREKLARLDWL